MIFGTIRRRACHMIGCVVRPGPRHGNCVGVVRTATVQIPSAITGGRLASAAAALAVAASGTIVAVTIAAAPAQAAYSCYTSTDNGSTWYDGKSASYRYDGRFSRSHSLSPTVLDSRTPQGLATWRNWNGSGSTLLLYTAYRDGRDAYIQGINAATGTRTRIIRVADSHVGGIAVVGGWAYVSGRPASDGDRTIRKYRLSAFRAVINGTASSNYVKQVGTARHVYGSSFLSSYGGYLFAGRFNADGRDKMYRYRVNSDGSLTTINGSIQVPKKTQGLVVTGSHYVFSTSYGREPRGNVYIVRRGYDNLDNARLSCFRAPSMAEGASLYDGKVYVAYESGSYKFRSDPDTRNVITRLHKVPLSSLTSLLG